MCRRREHIFGLFVPFFVDFSQEHEQALKNSQPHKAIFLGGTKSFCEKTGSGATTGGILRVSPKKSSRKDDSKRMKKGMVLALYIIISVLQLTTPCPLFFTVVWSNYFPFFIRTHGSSFSEIINRKRKRTVMVF